MFTDNFIDFYKYTFVLKLIAATHSKKSWACLPLLHHLFFKQHSVSFCELITLIVLVLNVKFHSCLI